MWSHRRTGARILPNLVGFPFKSREIWGIPRDVMTSQKLRLGSKVKVKPTQVKVKVKTNIGLLGQGQICK